MTTEPTDPPGDGSAVGPILLRTSDLSEIVDGVTEVMSSHTVEPTGSGPLAGRLDGTTVDDVAVFEVGYGLPVRLRADDLGDYVAVSVPLTSSMVVHHQGRRFVAGWGGCGTVATPGSELVMDWQRGVRLLVVRIGLDPLRRMAGRLLDAGASFEGLRIDPFVSSPALAMAVTGQARLLGEVAARSGPGGIHPVVAAQLREQLLGTVLIGQPSSLTERLESKVLRPGTAAVARACELMRARLADALTITEVAAAVGLSMRALHAGFRRDLGRSPKQFLQDLRLERARQDLQCAGPDRLRVVDVAYRSGFGHPGRFARAYRQRYGESPSATLGRVGAPEER